MKECLLNPSRLRLGLTVIIALMMVSSTTTVILFNPAEVLAYSRVIENSNGHSNPQMSEERSPSVSSPAAATTPIIQAPLQIPRTLQSNDLVNSLAFYEVTFITSTTGAVDKIEMVFPVGTNIAAAGVIERVGIGGGTLLKSASSLTYDVTTPVSVPAGTFIRLEMFGIKNPNSPSTTFTATITTRDSSGNLIDGPSQTNVYTIKQIGSNDIAAEAITSSKPQDGFMKQVLINDTPDGHAVGWNPNGVATVFEITEAEAFAATAVINVDSTVAADPVCSASQTFAGQIEIWCTSPPADGSTLFYMVMKRSPFHIIG